MSIFEFGAFDSALLSRVLKDGQGFTFVDGKADAEMHPRLMRVVKRRELIKQECIRRQVRFLPAQVMRPIFVANQVL